MLHFEAFHGVNANGQMACNQATAKANAWLEKHRSEIVQVISFSASQSGNGIDAEPGVEYILTLILEVSSAFGKHEHERGELAALLTKRRQERASLALMLGVLFRSPDQEVRGCQQRDERCIGSDR